jgi:hypothetical protein
MERRDFLQVTGLGALATMLGLPPKAEPATKVPELPNIEVPELKRVVFKKGSMEFKVTTETPSFDLDDPYDSYPVRLGRKSIEVTIKDCLEQMEELEKLFDHHAPVIFELHIARDSIWEMKVIVTSLSWMGNLAGGSVLNIEAVVIQP